MLVGLRMIRPCVLLAAFCLVGCGDPMIRLANHSDVVIENVRVTFHSQVEDYGTIAPNSETPYRTIAKAYRYAKVEATVNGEPAVLQPTDFVGEQLLGAGRYTYALDVNPG